MTHIWSPQKILGYCKYSPDTCFLLIFSLFINWKRISILIFIPIFVHHRSPYCIPTRIALDAFFRPFHCWPLSQPSLPDLGFTLVLKKEIKLIRFLHLNPTVSELNIYSLVKKWTKCFPLILALLNSLLPLSFCLYQEQTLIKPCYVSNFVYWASITNRNMLAKLLTHIN